MNFFWSKALEVVLKIFGSIIGAVTPTIVSELNELLTNLYKKAVATPNPWDDFMVGLLLDILAIPRPPPE